jgi:hypothetical protein
MDSEHQAGVQPALTAGFADAARQATDGFVERRKNDVAQAVADLATSIRQAAAGLERRSNIHGHRRGRCRRGRRFIGSAPITPSSDLGRRDGSCRAKAS